MTKKILKILSDDYCLHNKKRRNGEHQFTCISVYLQLTNDKSKLTCTEDYCKIFRNSA